MSEQNNESHIRAAFEAALILGLSGQPLTNKDGAIVDKDTGEVLMAAPEASFLSVVRAYLKDLKEGEGKGKVPQAGKPTELMDAFMNSPAGKRLPFGKPVQ